MKRTLSVVVVVALALLTFVVVSPAQLVFDDQFNGSSLDPAWVVSTNHLPYANGLYGAANYKYTVASSKVTFSDADPVASPVDPNVASAIDVGVATQYGHVFFNRSLSSALTNFQVTFDFAWDNTVGITGNDLAMPILAIALLDASTNVVARAGLSDAYYYQPGYRFGQIGGTTSFSGNVLPYSSTGNNQIILSRSSGNVKLTWAGNGAGTPFTMTGIATAPVEMISLDFARFRYDSGPAKLGSFSVDRVLVEIPEPSSLALCGLGCLLFWRRRNR